MNWCEKHDHFKRTCPWCEIEMLEAQLDQALEVLEKVAEKQVQYLSIVQLCDWAKEIHHEAHQTIQALKEGKHDTGRNRTIR